MRTGVPILVAVLSIALPASASSPRSTALRTGDLVPEFSAPTASGKIWKSSDFVGQKIILLYFYPADFQRASEQRARRFNEEWRDLKKRDFELVGVSGDSVENHRLFKRQLRIDFTLLADEAGKVAETFGVSARGGGTVRRVVDGKQVSIKRNRTMPWRYFAIDRAGKIAATPTNPASLADIDVVFEQLAADFWSNRPDKQAVWIPQSDRQWKRLLGRQEYLVTRRSHTEPKFSGKYCHTKTKGNYRCVGCGQVLFESSTKFESGTGWPSFWDPAAQDRIALARDRSLGMVRTEVKCSRCDSHLGHVFRDGPAPTGNRFCINSAALVLDAASGRTGAAATQESPPQ